MFRLVFSRRTLWSTLLVLAATAVLIRLGIWQLDRYDQAQSFNAHLKDVQAAPVLVLPDDSALPGLNQMEYRSVTATGRFDPENQIAIRNQFYTQTWGVDVGYTLLTPLILSNDQAVWVARGWIPSKYNTPDTWRQFDSPGVVEVEGVIRLPRVKGEMGGGVPDPALAPGQTRLDFWNYVNIERLQEQVPYRMLPVYIQQTSVGEPTSMPYPVPPVVQFKDSTNLGYALMWFFYAALVLVGYPVYLVKQEKQETK